LVEPHGGQLVHREGGDTERAQIDQYSTLAIADTDLMDCQQIAYGTYSPLDKFLGRDDLESVLDDHRLSYGTIWTLPIFLQLSDEQTRSLSIDRRIVLTDQADNPHAFLDVSDVYDVDLPDVARRWFPTD